HFDFNRAALHPAHLIECHRACRERRHPKLSISLNDPLSIDPLENTIGQLLPPLPLQPANLIGNCHSEQRTWAGRLCDFRVREPRRSHSPARRYRSKSANHSGSCKNVVSWSVSSATRMEPSTAVKAPMITAVFITSCSRLINCDSNSRNTSESCRIGVTTISGATAREA